MHATAHAQNETEPLEPGKALALVKQLEAEGKFLEAIDVLNACNRVHHHPQVEQRLIRVRHAAFNELDRVSGGDRWPIDTEDVFGEHQGIPEIEPSQLTSDLLASALTNRGSLIVRGLLSSERVHQFSEGIDRAIAGQQAVEEGARAAETTPWFVPFRPLPEWDIGHGRKWVANSGGVWTADSPRMMFELLEAFDEIHLGDVIAGYLGERPVMSVKKLTLRRVPVESGTDWHQDGAFLGSDIRTVNVWISLTSCGGDADAPGLDVVPCRLPGVYPTGTHGAQFDWSVGQGLVDEVAGDTPFVRPVFEPGDAILFDDINLHRTGVDPGMTHERYALESWFFAPSCYPPTEIPIVY